MLHSVQNIPERTPSPQRTTSEQRTSMYTQYKTSFRAIVLRPSLINAWQLSDWSIITVDFLASELIVHYPLVSSGCYIGYVCYEC